MTFTFQHRAVKICASLMLRFSCKFSISEIKTGVKRKVWANRRGVWEGIGAGAYCKYTQRGGTKPTNDCIRSHFCCDSTPPRIFEWGEKNLRFFFFFFLFSQLLLASSYKVTQQIQFFSTRRECVSLFPQCKDRAGAGTKEPVLYKRFRKKVRLSTVSALQWQVLTVQGWLM